MTTTIKCHFDGKTFVPDEPVDCPIGQPLIIRIAVRQGNAVILPSESGEVMTGRKLLDSEAAGMWADRNDIGDSVEFARALRRRAERGGK